MISLKILRNETEMCKRLIASKQGGVDLDHVLTLDKKLRQLKTISNEMRAERNSASEAIGKLKKVGEDASDSIKKTRELGDELKNIENEMHIVSKDLESYLHTVPNLPHESVPEGLDENSNVEIRSYGSKPEFNFEPRSHLDLGEALGLFDFQKGAKLSGSGFPLYIGKGATLER
ncbi:MAG: serine--tRNA ligase, partial [Candidatus Neomarinimicrobiota bacterium]